MEQTLLGMTVHFQPTETSNYVQGEIVAVWLEESKNPNLPNLLRVTIVTTDNKLEDTWLSHCRRGARPETEEETKERLRKRREREDGRR